MTIIELKAFIASKHKPELALLPGMVKQVWEDGEITCQKSGDLLWQRTLHSFQPGIRIEGLQWPVDLCPVKDSETHSYAFIADEDEVPIREAFKETALFL